MIVLIPSYQPDHQLVRLVEDLDPSWPVVIVDDGSGVGYAPLFTEAQLLGATVITLPRNRGKGSALKAGFRYIREHFPNEPVVCADSDGQHRPADIAKVATKVAQANDAMVLGVREFTGNVPLRSRFGNAVTAKLFGISTGVALRDTQTGLRGYPPNLLGWLDTVQGDRFEYELNLLLQASGAGFRIEQVGIETVYLDENESSHFRPIRDSARIYAPLLKFSASSVMAAGVDFVALLGLNWLTGSLFASVVGARALSSSMNFLANRNFVFESRSSIWASAKKYFALVLVILAANYALMAMLTGVGLGIVAAKVITEATLFAASFVAQRKFVFRDQDRKESRSQRKETVRV